MKNFLITCCLAGIFFSCKSSKDEKPADTTATISMLTSPASDSSAEPFLLTDKRGNVYLSWIEKKGIESSLRFSVFTDNKWTAPVTIVSGNNLLANWADYPALASDGNGNLIAHYLEKSDSAKFSYNIKIVYSNDAGKTWSPSKTLNDDKVKAEYGFVSMKPYQGNFFVSWLDGRNTGGMEDEKGHENHHGAMTLRGAMLDKDGNKSNEWELDGRVCDCCQTSVAITDNGPVVVYRDRSDSEIRDISVVRFVNGNWTEPKTIYADNWQIKACPVNGPRISAIGNSLAIAWFTMKDNMGGVKAVFSNNGGEAFTSPIHINEGNTIGRVGVVMLDTATAMVCWMEDSKIKAIKIHADGSKETTVVIANASNKRSSGFPQMTRSGNKIYFAWTDDQKILFGLLPIF